MKKSGLLALLFAMLFCASAFAHDHRYSRDVDSDECDESEVVYRETRVIYRQPPAREYRSARYSRRDYREVQYVPVQYAAPPTRVPRYESQEYYPETNRHDPAGAVIGGITGAIIGNSVGRGNGRVAATTVGTILGTIIGSNLSR